MTKVEDLISRLRKQASVVSANYGGATFVGHTARLCAEAASALSSLSVRVEELEGLLGKVLKCEYDASGLNDCIDNLGRPYQSAELHGILQQAEATLSPVAVPLLSITTPYAGGRGSERRETLANTTV
jgi:hypothetical protein